MHLFEIYLLEDKITPEQWEKLYKAVAQYGRTLNKFEITIKCTDNVIRFFIASKYDLGKLSNNLDGLVLRPVEKKDFDLPATQGAERFVQFVTGGNILDLKEKYGVKTGKSLGYAVFNVRVINKKRSVINSKLYFEGPGKIWTKSTKIISSFPSRLLSVDFEGNAKYLHKKAPKYLDIEKSLHMLTTDNVNAVFEVDAFPYFSHNYFLNLTSYDFDKHSFIVGASGSGKSKLISLFVDRISRTALNMNYRIIVVDPHASLAEDFEHIKDSQVITFDKQDSTDLFPGAGTDLTAATELTATLFKSILADQFNPRLDRLMRFTLFTLLTAQAMSLENMKRFLTDVEYRTQIVQHVTGYIPDNVVKFFGADYNEFRTQYYNETILPIVSMIEEMQLQPSLVSESEVSLAKTIQDNFLTIFSLNKVSMGDKVVKTVAGLLIQQIFLLAQARTFNQKLILIIDEVSVVQNPTLAQILAEARKFNLTVILTQQYFGQVEKELRDAIFANVYNYYTFKVSEEDARALEGNLNIELPKELVAAEHEKGVKEADIKVKMMTELHPRECLLRLLSNGQISPAVKARTVDAPVIKQQANTKASSLKAVLPDKFVEGSKLASEPIQFSHEFMDQLLKDSDSDVITPSNDSGAHTTAKRNIGSLRSMLARHSSSRTKLDIKEDEDD